MEDKNELNSKVQMYFSLVIATGGRQATIYLSGLSTNQMW